jgi:hypothetical protein
MKNRFQKISIDEFVEQTIKINPDLKAGELKRGLVEFKKRKMRGELCDCGNPLWIIGSAITGKGCFTCITGESDCSDDYEIG